MCLFSSFSQNADQHPPPPSSKDKSKKSSLKREDSFLQKFSNRYGYRGLGAMGTSVFSCFHSLSRRLPVGWRLFVPLQSLPSAIYASISKRKNRSKLVRYFSNESCVPVIILLSPPMNHFSSIGWFCWTSSSCTICGSPSHVKPSNRCNAIMLTFGKSWIISPTGCTFWTSPFSFAPVISNKVSGLSCTSQRFPWRCEHRRLNDLSWRLWPNLIMSTSIRCDQGNAGKVICARGDWTVYSRSLSLCV